jgi:hypothetical protein
VPDVDKDCVASTVSQHLQPLQVDSPLAHFDAQVSWPTGSCRFPQDEGAVGALGLEGACPGEVLPSVEVELEAAARARVDRRARFGVGATDDGDGIWQVVLDGHDSVVCAGRYGVHHHDQQHSRCHCQAPRTRCSHLQASGKFLFLCTSFGIQQATL